jgi:hypothetical protein
MELKNKINKFFFDNMSTINLLHVYFDFKFHITNPMFGWEGMDGEQKRR